MSMPASVIIPAYNRSSFITRAIRSVLDQSFTELELIVVDDGSTDNTKEKVEELLPKDSRIQLICHKVNRGAQAARNTGIEAASGKYIAFLDSDNEWLPQKLELQIALFSRMADTIGAVYCGFRTVSDNGEMLSEVQPKRRGNIYLSALSEWITDTSTLVVHRDILKKINGFKDGIRAFQEWDFCIRLARECEFDFVPESLTLYHEHKMPSISKDYLTNALGYLDVITEHQREIMLECGQSTLSKHYLIAGKLLISANRFDLARSSFLKSIQFYPLNIKAMIYFGMTFSGEKGYRFLKSLRYGK